MNATLRNCYDDWLLGAIFTLIFDLLAYSFFLLDLSVLCSCVSVLLFCTSSLFLFHGSECYLTAVLLIFSVFACVLRYVTFVQ